MQGSHAPLTGLRAWLAPPSLADEELTQRARTFWTVATGTGAIGSAFVLLLIVYQPYTAPTRALSIALLWTLVLSLLEVNRRGRTRLASWCLLLGLVALITQRAWVQGGISAPATPLFVSFMMMAGVLLGERGSLMIGVVCVACGALLVVGEETGTIPPPVLGFTPRSLLMYLAMTMGLSVVAQNLIARALRESLARAQAELGERQRAQQDLSDRVQELKEVQFELRKYQRGLEDLVAVRTAELEQSFERLKALERLRDDLVHMVVHDMRSPLTAMIMSLEYVRSELRGDLGASVGDAVASARALNTMCDTLLDVSRLEEGRMPLERVACDLVDLVAQARTAMAALESRRVIELVTRGEVRASCDVQLIRRVLENLISNGFKHTPPAGKLRLEVSARPGIARVSIQDEGEGVPAELRERIFEKFGSMAARRDQSYHSAGLGLRFCKLAVEAHGGRIGVESAVPRGSVFWFELPS